MIRSFLDVSTAHLTPDTMHRIDSGALGTAWQHPDGAGCFLHVPSDLDAAELPEDLRAVLRRAAADEVAYVCLDRDAGLIEGLPDHSELWETGGAPAFILRVGRDARQWWRATVTAPDLAALEARMGRHGYEGDAEWQKDDTDGFDNVKEAQILDLRTGKLLSLYQDGVGWERP